MTSGRELWHTIDFKLTEDNYQRFLRDGTTMTLEMALEGEPHFVKAILYDFSADRLGSAMVELKRK